MKRTLIISVRAMLGVAVVLMMALAMSRTASAQEEFRVKAASPADGKAGEYPLDYTIQYENGDQQDINITGDGCTYYNSPAGAGAPTQIFYQGIWYTVVNQTKLCFPPNPQGGCWCLCLQWIKIWNWWWIPNFFWYYDPCCGA